MASRFLNPHASTAFSLDKSGKQQKRMKDDDHLSFIRKLPSILSGIEGVEACHIRYGDPVYRKPRTAKGRKPDDCYTVPMTTEEHHQQHSMNEREFWRQMGIDPIQVALALFDVSGDVPAGKKIIQKFRKG